ncbi:type IX secretion system membrane protein PorP/SprF [Cesiribacter sp. SM1]|uniref:PorP/SprF family type IX secretion system membrane protein n=1 Tax=Cesiribacter sp. SM1 TaxID=2861196 RepID=UPI001CD7EAF2|nr:type IX secretion system membrane protein PorP/SprF [Cesiribacter sp. SM1]
MKIRSVYIFACLLLSMSVYAQQRPVFSQYMFNGLAINPAYAGSQKQFNATMLIRNQWVNMEGAPKTQTLSAHSSIDKKNIGLGLMLYREQIGVHADMGLYASYAYQIKFKRGRQLALGLQAGFNNLISDFGKLNSKHLDDPLLQHIRNFNPNFGTGVYYSTPSFYAGLSVPYMINNKLQDAIQESLTTDGREARYYFFNMGKVFDVHPDVKVKPSVLVRMQEGAPLGADLNVNFFLHNLINVGTSWRTGDAVIFLFELHLNENFSFGYSYDMVTSSLHRYTRGSHELILNYRIQLSPQPCHSYF